MPADHQTAIDEMSAIFRTAWLALGRTDDEIDWESVPNDLPPEDGQSPWARFRILFSEDAGEATLSDNTMNRRFRYNGVIIVQFFGKSGDGLQEVTNFAKMIKNAYVGVTTSGGVWFRNHRIIHVPQERSWGRRNLEISFQFDEVI